MRFVFLCAALVSLAVLSTEAKKSYSSITIADAGPLAVPSIGNSIHKDRSLAFGFIIQSTPSPVFFDQAYLFLYTGRLQQTATLTLSLCKSHPILHTPLAYDPETSDMTTSTSTVDDCFDSFTITINPGDDGLIKWHSRVRPRIIPNKLYFLLAECDIVDHLESVLWLKSEDSTAVTASRKTDEDWISTDLYAGSGGAYGTVIKGLTLMHDRAFQRSP